MKPMMQVAFYVFGPQDVSQNLTPIKWNNREEVKDRPEDIDENHNRNEIAQKKPRT